MSQNRHLNPEQKVIILRELLDNQVPISQLAEKHGYMVNPKVSMRTKFISEDSFKLVNSKETLEKH